MDSPQSLITLPHIAANNAEQVLQEIAHRVADHPSLRSISEKDILDKLKQREALASTGVGSGVAIPHCFIDGIDSFVVGLATVEQGIAFEAIDQQPVDLFFFIIAPIQHRNEHVKILSEISHAARQASVRNLLRKTTDPEQLAELLGSYLSLATTTVNQDPCQFQVFVQDEDLFEPILEEVSAYASGCIAVQELKTAGSYLNRVPLFFSLWSEQSKPTLRLITAVLDKRCIDGLTASIRQITGKDKPLNGVSIAVHRLLHHEGSIDF